MLLNSCKYIDTSELLSRTLPLGPSEHGHVQFPYVYLIRGDNALSCVGRPLNTQKIYIQADSLLCFIRESNQSRSLTPVERIQK